mmetsp:Transcript_1454/g.3035  ORF Transcript_1454/g.3035 Transcript_1454/m.3035 type:complete len:1153 (-) Transcript_1454:103-3561(-)
MFGCDTPSSISLDSQLLQIRTGEGKSMILGAAAVVLALLGFKARCVCYSEYLSDRDYGLFQDVFISFNLTKFIKYSKITTLSEDTTASKGDIRKLTEKLLRREFIGSAKNQPKKMSAYESRDDSKFDESKVYSHEKSQKDEAIEYQSDDESIDNITIGNEKELKSSDEDVSDAQIEQECVVDIKKYINSKQKHIDERIKNPDIICQSEDEGSNAQILKSKPRTAIKMNKSKVSVSLGVRENEEGSKNISANISKNCKRKQSKSIAFETVNNQREEILLVDEVDVFFGSEFYGQTYNQVTQIRESEVADILQYIWTMFKQGGTNLHLRDIQILPAYKQLQQKLPGCEFLLDNEIKLMLDQVKRVDEEPYYLDHETDKIGYKVMDTISFNVTYGYRTIFAYLKEANNGNLKMKDITLANALNMPVSCGQFSYANISPACILGVSGTLEAMGQYEKDLLANYGIEKFVYVPSVYGESNFQFDKAGEGILINSTPSDHYHTITDQIKTITNQKRAAIIFFQDKACLKKFVDSPFYPKLGRQKKVLTEELSSTDKEFIINKAATTGQVTLCSGVFGRGTDFFCKDEIVQKNGGVAVIQTFLSAELSEEIQIQGRTARQGKKGSYHMVLLESDLEKSFKIPCGEKDKHAKNDLYNWLCTVRKQYHDKRCQQTEKSLIKATEKDKKTHEYFDALLFKKQNAKLLFREVYLSAKKAPIPSIMPLDLAFIIDLTGSMGPYMQAAVGLINGLVTGENSIVRKLQSQLPEISFKIRLATLGFRDIDDNNQFQESTWQGSNHFTENTQDAIKYINTVARDPSGGGDLAEDILGAIDHCANWSSPNDWSSSIKFMMLLTDAPAHGMVPTQFTGQKNIDSYDVRHPKGLSSMNVIDNLIAKDINLVMCSFNPVATSRTEEELSDLYQNHPDNTGDQKITIIPIVNQQVKNGGSMSGEHGRHIIFTLDESGSMQHNWSGVVAAYNKYLCTRRQNQNETDLVSVVQFSSGSRVTVNKVNISKAPNQLNFGDGGTCFTPAAQQASELARATPTSHMPVIIFMSDGASSDGASGAAHTFSILNQEINHNWKSHLDLHVIAFGSSANKLQLSEMARASGNGQVLSSAGTVDLSNIFVDIAASQNVAEIFETEICKRISDAVSDKLSLEYLG